MTTTPERHPPRLDGVGEDAGVPAPAAATSRRGVIVFADAGGRADAGNGAAGRAVRAEAGREGVRERSDARAEVGRTGRLTFLEHCNDFFTKCEKNTGRNTN